MDYHELMQQIDSPAVVYCDPPYVPLSRTASFTSYAKNSFDLDDQAELANLAEKCQSRGVSVVISNHDTTLTRKLYEKATLTSIQVGRSISQKGASRGKVAELFALYATAAQPATTQLTSTNSNATKTTTAKIPATK